MEDAATTPAPRAEPMPPQLPTRSGFGPREYALTVHVLNAAGIVLPVLPIVGLGVALAGLDSARGTIWESHLRYFIRTFVIGLIITVVGIVLALVLVGLLVLLFGFVWWVVRTTRAFLAWSEDKPIENPSRFW